MTVFTSFTISGTIILRSPGIPVATPLLNKRWAVRKQAFNDRTNRVNTHPRLWRLYEQKYLPYIPAIRDQMVAEGSEADAVRWVAFGVLPPGYEHKDRLP